MTAFDYTSILADADALIAEFGSPVTVRRTANSGTGYDPTQTTTDYTTQGVITNLPRWYSSYAPNMDVLRTDRLGYIAAGPLNALGVTPTPLGDVLVANGISFNIIDVKPVYPAGLAVLYILQLRK